jgi:hypothetical protein
MDVAMCGSIFAGTKDGNKFLERVMNKQDSECPESGMENEEEYDSFCLGGRDSDTGRCSEINSAIAFFCNDEDQCLTDEVSAQCCGMVAFHLADECENEIVQGESCAVVNWESIVDNNCEDIAECFTLRNSIMAECLDEDECEIFTTECCAMFTAYFDNDCDDQSNPFEGEKKLLAKRNKQSECPEDYEEMCEDAQQMESCEELGLYLSENCEDNDGCAKFTDECCEMGREYDDKDCDELFEKKKQSEDCPEAEYDNFTDMISHFCDDGVVASLSFLTAIVALFISMW